MYCKFILLLSYSFFSLFFYFSPLHSELNTAQDSKLVVLDLVYACENNTEKWPGVHWAIEKFERPDIAIECVKLFPEEISKLTPSKQLWTTTGDWASEREVLWGHNEGYTALELAVRKGYEEVVKILLEYKADPSIARKEYVTTLPWAYTQESPLAIAIRQQNKPIIQLLLEHNAPIEHIRKQPAFHCPARDYSAFMYALEYFPDEEVLKSILAQGMKNKNIPLQEITQEDLELFKSYTFDPTETTGPWPPLHVAFYLGHYEAAKRLIELGAHEDPYSYKEITFWKSSISRPKELDEFAWECGDLRFVHLLLEANISSENILLRSLKEHNDEIFHKAIGLGIQSEKALKYAVDNDLAWAISALLPKEKDLSSAINVKSLYDKPALLLLMIENNAPLDHGSLLEKAVIYNQYEVVKLLIERCPLTKENISSGIKTAIKYGKNEIYLLLKRA